MTEPNKNISNANMRSCNFAGNGAEASFESMSDFFAMINERLQAINSNFNEKSKKNADKDESYKDNDNNIFTNSHSKLLSLINKERFLEGKLDYLDDLLNSVKELQDANEKHIKWLNTAIYRSENVRLMLRSERHFLIDLYNRLWLNSEIIDKCVKPLQDYENKYRENWLDEEKVLFIINKCTLLSRIPYLQNDYLEALRELNIEVQTRDIFNSSLFFRLGTLNFTAYNYLEAISFLEIAVLKLEKKKEYSSLSVEESQMLFYSYLMVVMAFEFCGQYSEALAYLAERNEKKSNQELCKYFLHTFKYYLEKLPGSPDLDSLLFHSDSEDHKVEVIQWLGKIFSESEIENDLGKIAKFSKTQNMALPENQSLHDFIHLLAHCLNEVGVVLLKENLGSIREETQFRQSIARQTIILSRALMMFVSEDTQFYKDCYKFKSCFATIFAEAGDFDDAHTELKKILKSDKYPGMDVISKAEIDFFYYLIHRMSHISRKDLGYVEDQSDIRYNHYLNCCYRNFDYDAIAHISLISFEYYLSTKLNLGSLSEIGKHFEKGYSEEVELQKRYRTFVSETASRSYNNWLNNECEKVQYTIRFLNYFFERSYKNGIQVYSRNSLIFDTACKYLHFYDIKNNFNENEVKYIPFSNTEEAIEQLKDLLSDRIYDNSLDYLELSNGNCTYFHIKTEAGIFKFIDRLSVSNNLFFICSDLELNLEKNIQDPMQKIRIYHFEHPANAVKEFFLFCIFMQIRADFVNPKSIFVLTPINNQGLCSYEVAMFEQLLKGVLEGRIEKFPNASKIDKQFYNTITTHNELSTEWLKRLGQKSDNIEWAISFLIDNDNFFTNITYTYFIPPDKEPIRAVLFKQNSCLSLLNTLFKLEPPSKATCNCQGLKWCKICAIPANNPSLVELFSSFLLVNWNLTREKYQNGLLLIWKDVQDSYSCWRLLFLKESDAPDIKPLLCNFGEPGDIFEKNKIKAIPDWPSHYNTSGLEKFLFICHSGKDEDLVKKELNDFFLQNQIRFWYDRTKIIEKDSWVEQVCDIINKDNCVGCVVLVTSDEFFQSPAINKEFSILYQKKKTNQNEFSIMPVFYNIGGENDVRNIIKKSYGFGATEQNEAQMKCQYLMLPEKDKVNIYLSVWHGTTLCEYERLENKLGRSPGSLVQACLNLNVIDTKILR